MRAGFGGTVVGASMTLLEPPQADSRENGLVEPRLQARSALYGREVSSWHAVSFVIGLSRVAVGGFGVALLVVLDVLG